MTGSSMEGNMGEDISIMGCLQEEGVHWSVCLSAGRGWSGCCLCWCMGKGRNNWTGVVVVGIHVGFEEAAGNHEGEEIHAGSWELNQARLGPTDGPEFGP